MQSGPLWQIYSSSNSTLPTVAAKYEDTTYEGDYEFLDDNTIVVALPDGTTSVPITLNTANPESLAKIELRAYGRRLALRARQ